MPMRSFRQNFGATVLGLKDERKIIVYGYGSGLHQSTSTLGFYPGINPQRVDPKQPKQMTFELYDTVYQQWSSLQVNSGIGTKESQLLFSTPCSYVCMINFEQSESTEKKDQISFSRDQKCEIKTVTDKIVLLQTPSNHMPTEVLLLTFTQKYKVPSSNWNSRESSAHPERATSSFFQPIQVTKLLDTNLKLEKLGFLTQNRKVCQSNCLIKDKNLYIFGGDSPSSPLFPGDPVFSNSLEIFNLNSSEESIFSSARARAFGGTKAVYVPNQNQFSTSINLDLKGQESGHSNILPLSECPSGLYL